MKYMKSVRRKLHIHMVFYYTPVDNGYLVACKLRGHAHLIYCTKSSKLAILTFKKQLYM